MEKPSPFRFRWHREPALHFLLIGAVLFLIHSRVQRADRERDRMVITVDKADLDVLRADFRKQFGRPPDPREDSLLLAERTQDEILFREALERGLDKGDEIVRRRLILKMEFFMEDIPGLELPSDGELEAFRKAEPDRYRVPAQAEFTHLFFNASRHGPRTAEHAARILARLRAGSLTAEAAATQSDPFIVETPAAAAAETEIAESFGPAFASRIFAVDTGSWQGPIPSAYGQHLVLVRARRQGREMDFAEAKPKLAADLSEAKKARARDAFLEGLRRKYAIEIRRKVAGESDTARMSGTLP